MNISCLESDEFQVELEIRGIQSTPQSFLILNRQLEEEQKFPTLLPDKPHKLAMRNSAHEIKICLLKINRIQSALDSDIISSADLANYQSRLLHIQNRLRRLQNVTGNLSDLESLFNRIRCLNVKIREIMFCGELSTVNNTQPPPEFSTPNVSKLPDSNQVNGTHVEQPTYLVDSSNIATPNNGSNTNDRNVDNNPSDTTHLFQQMMDKFDVVLSKINKNLNSPQKSIPPNPHNSVGINNPMHNFERVDERTLNRTIASWNLKFKGSASDVPIEKFLFRIEHMAKASRIPLDRLVDIVSCCFCDSALDWYWTFRERHANIPIVWDYFKYYIIERFQNIYNERHIKRLLEQRKQKFPRETFIEFMDDIQKIALQSKIPIPDGEILSILLNNMRPGLREKFINQEFTSVNHLANACRRVEQLWQELGTNPEGSTSKERHVHEIEHGQFLPPSQSNNVFSSTFEPSSHFDQTPLLNSRNSAAPNNSVPYAPPQNTYQAPTHGTFLRYANPPVWQPQCEQNDLDDQPELCALYNQYPRRNVPNAYNTVHQQKPPVIRTCWNCKIPGHYFRRCKLPMRNFCMVCGRDNTSYSDCVTCNSSMTENQQTKAWGQRESNLQNIKILPRKPTVVEDAASNTDPELYRRQRNM